MAYAFGDSWDCYAAIADATAGYWDSGTLTNLSLTAGRFAGSQAIILGSAAGNQIYLVKSSAQNDAIHHIVVAFRQTGTLTGTNIGCSFQLLDNTTGQCCICFRGDGTILLTSATPTGTVLATYSGAVTAQNTWFAFEFEVIISNTVGRFRARKNGNAADDFDSGAVLNTRPGANSYANKLQITQGAAAVTTQQIDDLLWRSDAASVPWVGDIRCYTRMPSGDASTQFARAPSPATANQTTAQSTTNSKAANAGLMSAFIAPYSGTLTTAVVSLNAGGTGNMKAAIYDSARAVVLATSNAVVNPVSGNNTVTFGTPLTVTKGTTYYLAFDQDVTLIYNVTGANQFSFTTAYASFPAASPATATASGPSFTVNITPTVSAEFVNETLQDGTTSYVYSSTPGHADLYGIAAIPSTPVATIAVTARAFMQKSDAGARTAAVRMKSGATTVNSNTATLASSSWGWTWRTELLDPATGAAWSAAAVNNVTVGPVVIA